LSQGHPLETVLLGAARRFWPELADLPAQRRVIGLGDVITVAYAAPLALGGLIALVRATDLDLWRNNLFSVWLLAALLSLFNRLRYFVIARIRADRYGSADGSLDGVILWSSENGVDWFSSSFPGAPVRAVVRGDQLIGFRGSSANLLSRTAEGWTATASFDLPEAVRIGYGSGRPGLVADGDGFLTQTVTGDVYWSADGSSFELIIEEPTWGVEIGMPTRQDCEPPATVSLDVPPVLVTPEGFLALVSRQALDPFGVWPVCEPDVWGSADGLRWATITGEPPFGPGAYLYDVDWRAGRLVAVGGVAFDEPAVWVSDDARTWRRIPFSGTEEPFELRRVDAGGLGWVILGELAERPGLVGWVSRDGECWETLPEAVQGRVAAVGNDRIIIADRIGFLDTWLGVVEGGVEVRCRS